MHDPLGISTTRDIFQLEGKDQLVIERLKILTSTETQLHATPLSILAEIPLGPFDLVVSNVDKRQETSSVQRNSSGQSEYFKLTRFSVESGGSAELKQSEFRTSAFLLLSVTVHCCRITWEYNMNCFHLVP